MGRAASALEEDGDGEGRDDKEDVWIMRGKPEARLRTGRPEGWTGTGGACAGSTPDRARR